MFIDKGTQAPLKFSPSDYPHTYVASTGNKVAATLLLLLMAGASGIFLWIFSFTRTNNDVVGQRILMLLFAVPIVLFPLLAWSTYRFRIVLHSDRIDYQGLFSHWSMRRDQIGNWRLLAMKNGKKLELISTEPGVRIRKCTLQFKPDAAFDAWFSDLPNSDLVELKQSEERIRQNLALGSTPEERMKVAARARKIARAVFFVVAAIAYWAVFYPYPYMLPIWICLAIPWLAIIVCWQGKGLYTLDRMGRNVATIDLTLFVTMPGCGLGLRVMQNLDMLNWTEAFIPGFFTALSLTFLIGLTNNWYARTLNKAMLYLFLCMIYAMPAVILTNSMLDASVPANYPVKILAHRQTHGKGAASYLTVTGWGPRALSNELVVSHTFYNSKTVGNTVCIHLHAGAYHMPWYSLGDCTPEELAVERARAVPFSEFNISPIPAALGNVFQPSHPMVPTRSP